MNAPAAIKGTFSDFRTVKSRKIVQLIVEVPIEEATSALNTLGGVPNPADSVWVAVARLKETSEARKAEDQDGEAGGVETSGRASASPSAPKRAWADLPPSQQAAIRCGEPSFIRWLQAADAEHAAMIVRRDCFVDSRRDLDTNHRARVLWHGLDTEYMQATGRMAVSP